MDDWPEPCEEAYYKLAKEDPDKLRRWVLSGTLSNAQLSFAAEILGETREECNIDILISLFNSSDSSLVREGVLYGLYEYLNFDRVKHFYEKIVKEVKNPSIRSIAEDHLEDLKG